MRILRTEISRWWLLLLVPVLIACLPILGFALIVAGHVVGGIIGPPAIWQKTRTTPSPAALAGRYIETERQWQGHTKPSSKALLVLSEDGSLQVSGLPESDGSISCVLSGTGKWINYNGTTIDLAIASDGRSGSCASGTYGSVALTRQSPPYKLHWVLGDPDSGEGIWLERQ